MIQYTGCTITGQEVPGEISLCFNITNCPHRCEGCFSPELRENIGESLLPDLPSYIARCQGMITCVCFMGEGNDLVALSQALSLVQASGLKACLYTGCDEVSAFSALLPLLDYLKVGSYKRDKGSLTSRTTNQRFYSVNDGALLDNTKQFQRKREEQ